MKRRKFNHKEEDSLQRLKRENDRLKKQVSSLRKQIARIDISRMENLQEILHKHDELEAEEVFLNERKEQEKRWRCYECQDGVLRLKVLERQDGIVYFRKCDKCSNRTKLKRWNKDVEGIE